MTFLDKVQAMIMADYAVVADPLFWFFIGGLGIGSVAYWLLVGRRA